MGKKPVDLTADDANLIGHVTSVQHPCLSNEEDTLLERLFQRLMTIAANRKTTMIRHWSEYPTNIYSFNPSQNPR